MLDERNLPRTVQVGFKVLQQLQRRLDEYPWIATICFTLQLATLLARVILSSIPQLWQLTQSPQVLAFWPVLDLSLSIAFPASILLLAAAFLLEFRLFNELGTLQQYKNLLRINGVVCAVLVFLLEGCYHLLGLYLFSTAAKLSAASAVAVWVAVGTAAVLWTLQSALLLKRRPYGSGSLLIGPLMSLLPVEISGILLLIGSSLQLYQTRTNREKLLYIAVLLTCLWSLLQLNYPSDRYLLALLNLCLTLLSAGAVAILYPFSRGRSTLEENQRLLKLQVGRAGGEERGLNIEEELLYEKYFQEVEHFQQVCLPPRLRCLSLAEWKEEAVERTLWEKICWDREKDPSFAMSLFYFAAGISLRAGVPSLLREMEEYCEKNSTGSIVRSYELYCLAQQIFRTYQQTAPASETALQISDIVQAEHHYHTFYSLLAHLLNHLADFWKDLLQAHLAPADEADHRLEVVMAIRDRLADTVKSLGQFRLREEGRLFQAVSALVDCYQGSQATPLDDNNKLERSSSFEYLVLEGERVRRASLKLLRTLGVGREEVEQHSIRSLLPANFSTYLEEVYRRFLEGGERGSFALPILHANGCLMLKKCQLYMLPSTGSAVQYLLTLETPEAGGALTLLYNLGRQRIELVNEQLREFLGVRAERWRAWVGGEAVFGSDVFQAELGGEEVDSLKNHELLKTKVVYPDFYLKRNSSYNYNDEVTLHLEQEFYFGPHQYAVLAVQSESYRQLKIEAELQTHSHLRHLTRDRNLHEDFAHEQFFCRIENPYKSKIIEKLSSVQTRSYQSLCRQVSLLKVALLLLALLNILLFRQFSSSKLTALATLAQTMADYNNEYVYLLRLYSSSYSHHLLTSDPNATANYLNSAFFSGTATPQQLRQAMDDLTAYYDQCNDANSQALMSTYLLYKGIEGHAQKDYPLYFSNFAISSNTLLTTFYDFIVQVEQGYADGSELPFLAQNYPSVAHIMPIYQQSASFSADYNQQYETVLILAYAYIAVVALAFILAFLLSFRMMSLHSEIRQLYDFVDRTDVLAVLQTLDEIRDSIGDVSTEKRSSRYEQMIAKTDIQSLREVSDERLESRARQELQAGCRQKVENTCRLMFYCPLALLFIGGLLYAQRDNMVADERDCQAILGLLQKFQVDEMWIERSYIELFQPAYYSRFFGTWPGSTSPQTPILKNHFPADNLPAVFAEDVEREEDLCQSAYLEGVRVPLFNLTSATCHSLESGLLSNGYSKTLEMYQSYVRSQGKLSFGQFLSTRAQGQLNKIGIIVYLRELLGSFLAVKKERFKSHLARYVEGAGATDLQVVGVGCCLAVALTVALVVNVLRLAKQMRILLQLVCILPPSAMYKIRMTNYIRKQDILAKIDKL